MCLLDYVGCIFLMLVFIGLFGVCVLGLGFVCLVGFGVWCVVG